MNTIMFVERPEDIGRMGVGFRLERNNMNYSPSGTIRIARFNGGFSPMHNHGYYGDIYMKRFIRKWKKVTFDKIQRQKEILMVYEIFHSKHYKDKITNDIVNAIVEFL